MQGTLPEMQKNHQNIKTMKCLPIIFLILTFNSYSQDKIYSNKSEAEKELKIALNGKAQHNVIDNKTIILKDKNTAINVAEVILFNLYGKENIQNQKPYKADLIDNYWVISGSLEENMLGGTFLIILDSRNSKVLKITHGK